MRFGSEHELGIAEREVVLILAIRSSHHRRWARCAREVCRRIEKGLYEVVVANGKKLHGDARRQPHGVLLSGQLECLAKNCADVPRYPGWPPCYEYGSAAESTLDYMATRVPSVVRALCVSAVVDRDHSVRSVWANVRALESKERLRD
jgi:hypothetical protein